MANSFKISMSTRPTLDKLRRRNKARIRKLSRMEIAHEQITVFLDRWVLLNFKRDGKLVGGWEKLARGGRWVKGRGLDRRAKILRDTGVLRGSFRTASNRRNAVIGTRIPYSKKHEFGSRADRIPRRRMLPRAKEVERDIEKIYDKFIRKNFPQRGERVSRR